MSLVDLDFSLGGHVVEAETKKEVSARGREKETRPKEKVRLRTKEREDSLLLRVDSSLQGSGPSTKKNRNPVKNGQISYIEQEIEQRQVD